VQWNFNTYERKKVRGVVSNTNKKEEKERESLLMKNENVSSTWIRRRGKGDGLLEKTNKCKEEIKSKGAYTKLKKGALKS
jgi:hypothetical protein